MALPPLHICLVVHCFYPEHYFGTETYTLNLAEHFQKLGHRVSVLSALPPGDPGQDEFMTRLEFRGIPIFRFDKNQMPPQRVRETYLQDSMRAPLRAVLEEISPDLVHVTHLVNHSAVLLDVAEELDLPTFATLTDFFGFCFNSILSATDGQHCAGPDPGRGNCFGCYVKAGASTRTQNPWIQGYLKSAIHRELCRVLPSIPGVRKLGWGRFQGALQDVAERPEVLKEKYSKYWGTIAPSRFLKAAYEKHMGLDLALQNFGVEIDRSPKPPRPPEEPVTFGFIGQISAHKGPDLLLEAFRDIPQARLILYGPRKDPVFFRKLEALAQEAKSPVEFRSSFSKEEMAEKLRELDVLVIPSRWYENSPLVLLDALATHTPVVVSDVEGMTEFLDPGQNGFAFPMGDRAALEAILRSLAEDPESTRRLSRTTQYERTLEDMAQDVLDLFEDRLRERGRTLRGLNP